MKGLELLGKFVSFRSEERTKKDGKGTYTFEELLVFVDDVGKIAFSFGGLRLDKNIDFASLKEGQKIRIHCGLDSGQYSVPILYAKDIDIV